MPNRSPIFADKENAVPTPQNSLKRPQPDPTSLPVQNKKLRVFVELTPLRDCPWYNNHVQTESSHGPRARRRAACQVPAPAANHEDQDKDEDATGYSDTDFAPTDMSATDSDIHSDWSDSDHPPKQQQRRKAATTTHSHPRPHRHRPAASLPSLTPQAHSSSSLAAVLRSRPANLPGRYTNRNRLMLRKPKPAATLLRISNHSGGTDIYEHQGRRCVHPAQHAPESRTPEPRTPESLAPESPSFCAILSAFGLSFNETLRFIHCTPHGSLIPLSALSQHLGKRHRSECGSAHAKSTDVQELLIHHISTSFNIHKHQTSSDINSTLELSEPLPGIVQQPNFCAQCPGCSVWFRCSFGKQEAYPRAMLEEYSRHIAKSRRDGSACHTVDDDIRGLRGLSQRRQDAQSYLKFRYCQSVFGGIQTCSIRVPLRDGWMPVEGHIAAIPPPLALGDGDHTADSNPEKEPDGVVSVPHRSVPEWLHALQWLDLFPELKIRAKDAIRHIENPRLPINSTWPTEQQAIELGLCAVRKYSTWYTADANKFISRFHRHVRDSLTMGTRSKYRDIQPSSFTAYSKTLFKTILMLIRSRLFRTKEFRRYRKKRGLAEIGLMTVPMNTTLRAPRDRLYDLLNSTGGKPDMAALGPLVHALADEILCYRNPLTNRIGGPTDFVIMLNSLGQNGQFDHDGNVVTKICSEFQYVFRSIYIHHTRLQGKEYEPAMFRYEDMDEDAEEGCLLDDDSDDEGDDGARVEVEDEDEDEDDVDAENPTEVPNEAVDGSGDGSGAHGSLTDQRLEKGDEGEAEDVDDVDDIPEVMEEEEDAGSDVDQPEEQMSDLNMADGVDFMERIMTGEDRELLYLFLPIPGYERDKIRSTAFNRMKSTWHVVGPHAFSSSARTSFRWSADGQSVTMDCARKGPQVIHMADLQRTTQSAISRLPELIYAMLPDGVPQDALDFDINSIEDLAGSRDSESFLYTTDSAKLFGPMVSQVWAALTRPGESSHHLFKTANNIDVKATDKWLGLEQCVLKQLAFSFELSCGNPPRAFQLLDVRFHPEEGGQRNVFHASGVPVFAWPRSKNDWRPHARKGVWALPISLAWPLYIYLRVIRPITIKLMEMLGRPTALHKIYVFVHSKKPGRRETNMVWATHYLNHVFHSLFESHGSSMRLDDRQLRQLFNSIVTQHLPHLVHPISSNASTAVHRQGQHDPDTVKANYGLVSSATGMSISMIQDGFAVSQVWQAWKRLIPLEERWRVMFLDVPVRLQEENRKTARHLARWLVVVHYDISRGLDAEQISCRTDELLTDCPFLWGKASSGSTLGDNVLVLVTAAMIWGHGKPDQLGSIPVGGFEVGMVADALLQEFIQIQLAIQEWRTGVYVPISPLASRANLEAIDYQRKLNQELLARQKAENPDGWIQFSQQVRMHGLLPEEAIPTSNFTAMAIRAPSEAGSG